MSNDSISGLSFSFDADPGPDGKGNFGIFDGCQKILVTSFVKEVVN